MKLYLPAGQLRRPEVDLSDLTASQRCGDLYWDPESVDVLVIPMDPEPSEAEQVLIRRRLVTVDAADEAHLDELLATVADPLVPSWARLVLRVELEKYGEHVAD